MESKFKNSQHLLTRDDLHANELTLQLPHSHLKIILGFLWVPKNNEKKKNQKNSFFLGERGQTWATLAFFSFFLFKRLFGSLLNSTSMKSLLLKNKLKGPLQALINSKCFYLGLFLINKRQEKKEKESRGGGWGRTQSSSRSPAKTKLRLDRGVLTFPY